MFVLCESDAPSAMGSVSLRSGLTTGLLPLLANTSLNFLDGDFPRALLGSSAGFSVSALSIRPESGGRAGMFCTAGDLGDGFALGAEVGSRMEGKCSVEAL